jgi:hypothetical protein
MHLPRPPRWIVTVVASIALVLSAAAQTTLSSTSGPASWDFGPVVAGTVVNEGVQDICPPGM